MNTAVACGLIVNELVSNALKYAFPEERMGAVRIALRATGNATAKLTVADDGVGLPEDLDWRTSHSLGLRLVRTLAQQLLATVEYLEPASRLRFHAPFDGVL